MCNILNMYILFLHFRGLRRPHPASAAPKNFRKLATSTTNDTQFIDVPPIPHMYSNALRKCDIHRIVVNEV